VHQRLVDRSILEGEAIDILGQRQLGDRQLVSDRSGLLLGYFGLEQLSGKPLWLMLALECRGEQFILGVPHAEELELAHHGEHIGALHAHVLLS